MSDDSTTLEPRLAHVREGQALAESSLALLGIDTSLWPLNDVPSYEEIEETARIEKLREEGFIR